MSATHAPDCIKNKLLGKLDNFLGNIIVLELGSHSAQGINTVLIVKTGEFFHDIGIPFLFIIVSLK